MSSLFYVYNDHIHTMLKVRLCIVRFLFFMATISVVAFYIFFKSRKEMIIAIFCEYKFC